MPPKILDANKCREWNSITCILLVLLMICLGMGCGETEIQHSDQQNAQNTAHTPPAKNASVQLDNAKIRKTVFFASPADRERIDLVLKLADATQNKRSATQKELDNLRSQLQEHPKHQSQPDSISRNLKLALAASALTLATNSQGRPHEIEAVQESLRNQAFLISDCLNEVVVHRNTSPPPNEVDEIIRLIINRLTLLSGRRAQHSLWREWSLYLNEGSNTLNAKILEAISAIERLSQNKENSFWKHLAWAIRHASPENRLTHVTLGHADQALLMFDLFENHPELIASFAKYLAIDQEFKFNENSLDLLLIPDLLQSWTTYSKYAEEWQRAGRPFLIRLKDDSESRFLPFLGYLESQSFDTEQTSPLNHIEGVAHFAELGIKSDISDIGFIKLHRSVFSYSEKEVRKRSWFEKETLPFPVVDHEALENCMVDNAESFSSLLITAFNHSLNNKHKRCPSILNFINKKGTISTKKKRLEIKFDIPNIEENQRAESDPSECVNILFSALKLTEIENQLRKSVTADKKLFDDQNVRLSPKETEPHTASKRVFLPIEHFRLHLSPPIDLSTERKTASNIQLTLNTEYFDKLKLGERIIGELLNSLDPKDHNTDWNFPDNVQKKLKNTLPNYSDNLSITSNGTFEITGIFPDSTSRIVGQLFAGKVIVLWVSADLREEMATRTASKPNIDAIDSLATLNSFIKDNSSINLNPYVRHAIIEAIIDLKQSGSTGRWLPFAKNNNDEIHFLQQLRALHSTSMINPGKNQNKLTVEITKRLELLQNREIPKPEIDEGNKAKDIIWSLYLAIQNLECTVDEQKGLTESFQATFTPKEGASIWWKSIALVTDEEGPDSKADDSIGHEEKTKSEISTESLSDESKHNLIKAQNLLTPEVAKNSDVYKAISHPQPFECLFSINAVNKLRKSKIFCLTDQTQILSSDSNKNKESFECWLFIRNSKASSKPDHFWQLHLRRTPTEKLDEQIRITPFTDMRQWSLSPARLVSLTNDVVPGFISPLKETEAQGLTDPISPSSPPKPKFKWESQFAVIDTVDGVESQWSSVRSFALHVKRKPSNGDKPLPLVSEYLFSCSRPAEHLPFRQSQFKLWNNGSGSKDPPRIHDIRQLAISAVAVEIAKKQEEFQPQIERWLRESTQLEIHILPDVDQQEPHTFGKFMERLHNQGVDDDTSVVEIRLRPSSNETDKNNDSIAPSDPSLEYISIAAGIRVGINLKALKGTWRDFSKVLSIENFKREFPALNTVLADRTPNNPEKPLPSIPLTIQGACLNGVKFITNWDKVNDKVVAGFNIHPSEKLIKLPSPLGDLEGKLNIAFSKPSKDSPAHREVMVIFTPIWQSKHNISLKLPRLVQEQISFISFIWDFQGKADGDLGQQFISKFERKLQSLIEPLLIDELRQRMGIPFSLPEHKSPPPPAKHSNTSQKIDPELSENVKPLQWGKNGNKWYVTFKAPPNSKVPMMPFALTLPLAADRSEGLLDIHQSSISIKNAELRLPSRIDAVFAPWTKDINTKLENIQPSINLVEECLRNQFWASVTIPITKKYKCAFLIPKSGNSLEIHWKDPDTKKTIKYLLGKGLNTLKKTLPPQIEEIRTSLGNIAYEPKVKVTTDFDGEKITIDYTVTLSHNVTLSATGMLLVNQCKVRQPTWSWSLTPPNFSSFAKELAQLAAKFLVQKIQIGGMTFEVDLDVTAPTKSLIENIELLLNDGNKSLPIKIKCIDGFLNGTSIQGLELNLNTWSLDPGNNLSVTLNNQPVSINYNFDCPVLSARIFAPRGNSSDPIVKNREIILNVKLESEKLSKFTQCDPTEPWQLNGQLRLNLQTRSISFWKKTPNSNNSFQKVEGAVQGAVLQAVTEGVNLLLKDWVKCTAPVQLSKDDIWIAPKELKCSIITNDTKIYQLIVRGTVTIVVEGRDPIPACPILADIELEITPTKLDLRDLNVRPDSVQMIRASIELVLSVLGCEVPIPHYDEIKKEIVFSIKGKFLETAEFETKLAVKGKKFFLEEINLAWYQRPPIPISPTPFGINKFRGTFRPESGIDNPQEWNLSAGTNIGLLTDPQNHIVDIQGDIYTNLRHFHWISTDSTVLLLHIIPLENSRTRLEWKPQVKLTGSTKFGFPSVLGYEGELEARFKSSSDWEASLDGAFSVGGRHLEKTTGHLKPVGGRAEITLNTKIDLPCAKGDIQFLGYLPISKKTTANDFDGMVDLKFSLPLQISKNGFNVGFSVSGELHGKFEGTKLTLDGAFHFNSHLVSGTVHVSDIGSFDKLDKGFLIGLAKSLNWPRKIPKKIKWRRKRKKSKPPRPPAKSPGESFQPVSSNALVGNPEVVAKRSEDIKKILNSDKQPNTGSAEQVLKAWLYLLEARRNGGENFNTVVDECLDACKKLVNPEIKLEAPLQHSTKTESDTPRYLYNYLTGTWSIKKVGSAPNFKNGTVTNEDWYIVKCQTLSETGNYGANSPRSVEHVSVTLLILSLLEHASEKVRNDKNFQNVRNAFQVSLLRAQCKNGRWSYSLDGTEKEGDAPNWPVIQLALLGLHRSSSMPAIGSPSGLIFPPTQSAEIVSNVGMTQTPLQYCLGILSKNKSSLSDNRYQKKDGHAFPFGPWLATLNLDAEWLAKDPHNNHPDKSKPNNDNTILIRNKVLPFNQVYKIFMSPTSSVPAIDTKPWFGFHQMCETLILGLAVDEFVQSQSIKKGFNLKQFELNVASPLFKRKELLDKLLIDTSFTNESKKIAYGYRYEKHDSTTPEYRLLFYIAHELCEIESKRTELILKAFKEQQ